MTRRRPTILVLTPAPSGVLSPPEAMPLGRVAREMARSGTCELVFGHRAADRPHRVDGLVVADDRWVPASSVPVAAVYDRFASQREPAAYEAAQRAFGDLPWGNAPDAIALCRDKLVCQRVLEAAGVRAPEVVEAGAAEASERASEWDAVYVKPRYGSFGAGVSRRESDSPLPVMVEGAYGRREPALLQRPVIAPRGLRAPDGGHVAALSIRALVQRDPDGDWICNPPVARVSVDDPVVNVKRGARAWPLSDVLAEVADRARVCAAVEDLALASAMALSAHVAPALLIEAGVDIVLDDELRPWVIEVNGKPRGHLEVLAAAEPERFGERHAAARSRPLRWLAAEVGHSS